MNNLYVISKEDPIHPADEVGLIEGGQTLRELMVHYHWIWMTQIGKRGSSIDTTDDFNLTKMHLL